MLNLIPNDSSVLKPGQVGHGGQAAMTSSRDRKRGR